jgi:hypothetical protein
MRKSAELRRMEAEILELRARLKFIEAILSGALVVAQAEDDVLLAGLKGLSLPPLSARDSPDDLKAYDYLLRIRIDRIKASAVEELRKQVAAATAERDLLASKSPEMLWIADLDEFEVAYAGFLTKRAAITADAQKSSDQKVVKKKVAGKR